MYVALVPTRDVQHTLFLIILNNRHHRDAPGLNENALNDCAGDDAVTDPPKDQANVPAPQKDDDDKQASDGEDPSKK